MTKFAEIKKLEDDRFPYPDYFRIGTVTFLIPPSIIRVSRLQAMEVHGVVRGPAGIVQKPGHATVNVQIELYFDRVWQIRELLVPLIIHFKNTPFVPVVNFYLNMIQDIDALTLRELHISTMEGFPNLIRAILVAEQFNWRGYITQCPEGSLDGTKEFEFFDDIIVRPIYEVWIDSLFRKHMEQIEHSYFDLINVSNFEEKFTGFLKYLVADIDSLQAMQEQER